MLTLLDTFLHIMFIEVHILTDVLLLENFKQLVEVIAKC